MLRSFVVQYITSLAGTIVKIQNRGEKMSEEYVPTVVLGVIGADVHAIGNQILEHALEEVNIKAVNIGVMSSQQEFVEAAVETGADAIWVSSLYGHGEMDCRGLRDKCIEAGIGDILLYVGGNLVIGKKDWEETKEKFIKMGYDRAYPPGTRPQEAIDDLCQDLSLKKDKNDVICTTD